MGNMYSENNQFQFKCPVFDAQTKLAACEKLRSLHYVGKGSEKRKGCQACMSAGKCPVAKMHQRSWQTKMDTSRYFSTTPVSGKLEKSILAAIEKTVVMDSTFRQFGVSAAEIRLIETSGERIAKQMGTAPGDSKALRSPSVASKTNKPRTVKKPTSVDKAAASGDMSAAINKE